MLTAANDTINGAVNGALTSADVIIDYSTSDADTLTAVVNAAAGASNAARIQNVENINISGQYVTTGLALTNVSGADTLTLSAGIAGATATVTDANSTNVATIVAGTNVGTLTVTSLSSGTRDAVTLNATTASNVDVTGNDGGADTYVVNVATGADVDLATLNASDAITINAVGTLALAGVAALGDLTINASNDLTVDVTTGLAATTVVGNSTHAVTLSGAEAVFDGKELSKTGTGTLTVEVTDNDDTNLKEILADKVVLSDTLAAGDLFTVNEGSTVVLTGAGSADLQIENATGTITTGTLMLEVANDYTLITTNDNIDTLMISGTPDEDDETIVVTDLALNAATDTIVMTGGDLTITTLTVTDAKVIAASSMTGALTMTTSGNSATTVVLGNGNNSITTVGGADLVQGGSGADTISAGAAVDTIVGGAGNDSITGGAGDDSITGGEGNDSFVIGNGDGNDTITDFVAGSDKIILTGDVGAVDVTDLTVASGVYTIGDLAVTLTGNTATDLSGSIQLGKSTVATAFTVTTLESAVGGNFGDTFTHANDANVTITGGAGADVFYVTNDTLTQDANDMTVTDFTAGTDKIIITGTAKTGLQLDDAVVSGTEAFDLSSNNEFQFTLEDVTFTSLEGVVQLGDSTNDLIFTSFNDGTTDDNEIVGGNFNDYVTISTVTNDATIDLGLGADELTLNATGDDDTIIIAAGDSTITAWDQITNFGMNDAGSFACGNDVLDLDSTTVGTGLGSVDVGDIASASVASGIVTFKDASGNAISAADLNLTDALNFMATNAVGTDTFAFEAWVDADADGDNTDAGDKSTYVFQSGTTDTVVELVGLTGVIGFGAGTSLKIELA